MSLSLAEIKRAKVQTFRDVADGLEGMAEANRDMKRGVERLPIMGDGWKGVSGDAAHHELDGHGRYLEGHADAQTSAARRIRVAADEFEGVQQLLKKIENDAANGKFSINYDTGQVTPPNGKYDKNELDYLTNTLRQIQAAGDRANADLESAVKAAKTLPDPSSAAAQALPAVPGSAIKPSGAGGALQNLAAPNPDSQPAETRSAAAGADTQANYKEWYPKAPATGDKITIDPTKAGSFAGTVGALDKLPGTPKPPDGFGTGVARQFGQGVNQAIDGMIDEAKSKVGLNGADKFKEAWVGTAKGIENEMVNQLLPGVGMAQDAKGMIDQGVTSYQHPETIPKNIGAGLAQAGAVAATGPLAGEAAAGARGLIGDATIAGRGGLLDPPTLPHDMPPTAGHAPAEVPSGPTYPGPVADHSAPILDHPSPTGGDHSGGGGGGFVGDHTGGVGDHGGGPGGHGMPGGNPAPFDFDNPLQTARPEFNIPNPLDVMSPELRGLAEQHLTGSGETVLGPFKPETGGPSYIEVAKQHGASYFDIGEAWNSATPTQQLAANQHVLDTAIANRDTIKLSVPFYEIRPDTYTGAELRYIQEHGYQRINDTTFAPPAKGGSR
ncbi:endonuclease [Mycobacteroides abscessus]|uniref:endonuclease n=1 Tax=Mycobacteroides abscessus TaxID=36809 RepID=UPI002104F9D9|nr:endonuclease [Mycobacteroides abscessus]